MKLRNVKPQNVKTGGFAPAITSPFRYIKFEVTANNGDADITTVGDVSFVINSTNYPQAEQ